MYREQVTGFIDTLRPLSGREAEEEEGGQEATLGKREESLPES